MSRGNVSVGTVVSSGLRSAGGNARLVTGGERRDFGDSAAHPRSGVGLSEDGKTMYLVTIDGRQAHARGMTLTEFSDFIADIGADEALNLDGGGSSTLVARDPGSDELKVANSLSTTGAAGAGSTSGTNGGTTASGCGPRSSPGWTSWR